jgi:hypothetical protein
MNHSTKIKYSLYLIGFATLGAISCNKENSTASTSTSTDATTTATTIAVAATTTLASTDSIYILQPCGRGQSRDSVSALALPASITTYLTNNYTGYTFKKAYTIKNSNGTIDGYVAVIYYNSKPVGVLFNSNGNFVRVLEQREKGDIDGKGWHLGGRFEDRGGIKKDTVALGALPATISSYFTNYYATDTLLKAFTNRDSSYLVVSKDNGLYVSLFDSKGNFIRRVELPFQPAHYQVKELANLPSTITSYLDTAYTDYTLKKAYTLSLSGPVKAYIVIIDANSTRYALEFDATGSFVRVKTLF